MITQKIRSAVRQGIASVLYYTNYSLTRLRGKVVILTYHRVLTDTELAQHYVQPGMYVRIDVFAEHMLFLKKYFHLLTFPELLTLWQAGPWDNKKRYCVVTFDDGWLDNYRHAYRVLKKNNIPATIFLPTDLIGTNEWFWPDKMSFILCRYYLNTLTRDQMRSMDGVLNAYPWMARSDNACLGDKIELAIDTCKTLHDGEIQRLIAGLLKASGLKLPEERQFMNWKEIREMSHYGISFGSHARSHKILTRLPRDEVRNEIECSIASLRAHGVNNVPIFCYPNGNDAMDMNTQLKTAGYHAAVGTVSGIERCAPSNLYNIRRIGIHHDVSKTIPLFAYRLLGNAIRQDRDVTVLHASPSLA